MSSQYTVVQYIPDPAADERINVGVIVWDSDQVRSQFLNNWKRVRSFTSDDTGFLENFADEVSLLTLDPLPLLKNNEERKLDAKRLETMIASWAHCIQFTASRGSLKDAKALLKEVAPIFLREPPPSAKRARGRRTAASKAINSLLSAVGERSIEKPENFVTRYPVVGGDLADHRFDVGLKNGKLCSVAQALSFEINVQALRREIDATAWMLDDVGKKRPDLPLSVCVFRPKTQEQKKLYEEASGIFQGLNSEVVTESQFSTWAREQAKLI